MSIEKHDAIEFIQMRRSYTSLPNDTSEAIGNLELNGMWSYLMTKPEYWKISVPQLMKHFGCGRDKIRKVLKGLIDIGLMSIVCNKNAQTGLIEGNSYHLYDTFNRAPENPGPGFTGAGVQDTSNTSNLSKTRKERNNIREVENTTAQFPSTDVGRAEELFKYWQEKMGHPRAKLDAKRKALIVRALKQYTMDDLKNTINGYSRSEFHMANISYHSIGLIFRDADHLERFMHQRVREQNKPKMMAVS